MKSALSGALAVGISFLVSGAIHAAPIDNTPPAKVPKASADPASGSKAMGGPRLSVEKPVVDAGDVVRGDVAVAVFEVRNTGDQVLKILDARPGCGCTVTDFDKTIAPGESGKVTASVKTENFRGPIEKTVSLTSSDASNGMVTLRVKANVVGSVEVLPSLFLALPSPPLFEYTGKLLIRQDKTEKGELKITDVTTSVPWLTASVRKVKSPEPAFETIPAAVPGDWILDLSATDDAPAETGNQRLTFKTGLTREPQLTIPLSISFAQPMQANPASLIMVAPQGTPTITKTFLLSKRPGLGKEEVTARAEPDVFTVKIEHDTKLRYKATVVWNAKGDAPPHDGTVTVSAGQETLRVPVRVIERPASVSRGGETPPDPGQPGAAARAVSDPDKPTP